MKTDLSTQQMDWKKLIPVLIIMVGVLAYANSFSGAFIFDDARTTRTAFTLWQSRLSGSGTIFSQRPVTDATFALNYMAGLNPADYHAVNLLIHILAGLLLYGVVRRTLLLPVLRGRFGNNAMWLAFASSVIWVSHPLTTSAVTYISQRYECLMAMFYLLTPYCVIRGSTQWTMVNGQWSMGKPPSSTINHQPSTIRSTLWYVTAVIVCALGMGSKEIMITAPVIVLIYDRIFLSQSFREVLRRRRGLYAGLAATWVLLAFLMTSRSFDSYLAAGSQDVDISTITCDYLRFTCFYFLTQCGVIIHYLRLCFWPDSLCIDYAWPLVERIEDALPSVIFVGSLALLTLTMLRHCPPAGFLGLFFFIVLSPTSSFVPRPDCVFEHRMYLPLTAVVTGAVLTFSELLNRASRNKWVSPRFNIVLTVCVFILVVVSMVCKTHFRNRCYYSAETMWRDIFEKRPGNFRAKVAYTSALLTQGKFVEAETLARRMLTLVKSAKPADRGFVLPAGSAETYHAHAYNLLGRTLFAQNKTEEATECFRKAIELRPDFQYAYRNLGLALFIAGNINEAIHQVQSAIAIDPDYGEAHVLLAVILTERREFAAAVKHYQKAMLLAPDSSFAKCKLAWLLATCPDNNVRDGKSAVKMALAVCDATDYRSFRALDVLAAAYAETGRFERAIRTCEQALSMASKTAIRNQHEPITATGKDEAGVVDLDAIRQRLQLYQNRKPFRDVDGKDAFPILEGKH